MRMPAVPVAPYNRIERSDRTLRRLDIRGGTHGLDATERRPRRAGVRARRGGRRHGPRPGLADEAGARDRAARPRRGHRRGDARDRATAGRGPRPVGGGREPAGRGGPARHRGRREGGARRLYLGDVRRHEHHLPVDREAAEPRPGDELRAGHDPRTRHRTCSIAHPSVPANNLQELVAYAKQNPRTLSSPRPAAAARSTSPSRSSSSHRHRRRARAVQGRRRGDHRRGRRAGEARRPRHGAGAAAHPVRAR